MNLEILDKTEHKLVFVIEGISVELVNSLRRIIKSEIPVLSISEVIILKNDSPLYDEIIAHRLGMIPLKTDLTYKKPTDCEGCGGYGCSLCQVSLTCEIENSSNNPVVIYSGDLESNDPNVVPVDPNIPIVKINKKSKLIIEAYATMGTGTDHAKHNAANVSYRFYPIIEFNDANCKNCPDKCIAARMCPRDLFDVSGKLPQLVSDYWKTCILCNACQDNCPEESIICP